MLTVQSNALARGRLIAAGRVVLDSWFEGDVVCSRLEIGPDGYVRGTVIAHEVVSSGQVVGIVHASSVHLLPGAFVEGDIRHSLLKLDRGATLSGRALRHPALQFPPELLDLEARAAEGLDGSARLARTPVRRISKLPPISPHLSTPARARAG